MPEVSIALAANRLLACPVCAASDFSTEAAALTCRGCSAVYEVRDGIVDFVGGRLETTLDSIDYDSFYGVDDQKMSRTLDLVRQHVGFVFDRPLGSVIELGAGTGLLTAGLVRSSAAERLLVTDLSRKMLAACRRRVLALAPETGVELCFATNDGVTLGVKAGEFDLALGYFVVHHILDWRATLSAVHRATSERGVAVFIEPNRRFHLALVLVMHRVLERLLPEMPDLPGSDLSLLLNLVSEWDFTLKYRDCPAALSRQEDKHFFDRGVFEAACRAAGWAFANTLRFDSRTGPLETANVYAAQLKLSPKGAARFLDVFLSELPGPFALLDDVDASPSYVFVTGKSLADADICVAPATARGGAPVGLASPENGYAAVYDLSVTIDPTARRVTIEGWIAATRVVMRVVLSAGSLGASATVGRRRVDVVRGMARLRRHPFANLLHSGIRDVEETTSVDGVHEPLETMRVVAELDDGRELVLVDGKRLARTPSGAFKARISVLD